MASASSSTPQPETQCKQGDDEDAGIVIHDTPVCLVLGMAGSGKTTFVDALSAFLEDGSDSGAAAEEIERLTNPIQSLSVSEGNPLAHPDVSSSNNNNNNNAEKDDDDDDGNENAVFVVNLDPAVHELPYEANIDIRDTINYKNVMRDYKLGPNGSIITSLNLYATRFDQVLSILEKRHEEYSHFLVDTPGQIETFTWSASGSIICDALSYSYPTVILYVVDVVRCHDNCMTFVSNMLYACSIMYKMKLPMVLIFNKRDALTPEQCAVIVRWLSDFDALDSAVSEHMKHFTGDLARSMALSLYDFYSAIPHFLASSLDNEGLQHIGPAINTACQQYYKDFLPALRERKRQKAQADAEAKDEQLTRFRRDRMSDGDNHFLSHNQNAMDRGGDGEEGGEDEGVNEGNAVSRLTPDQRERLRRIMKQPLSSEQEEEEEEEEDDREEREAYEEYRKYVEAMRGKR